MNDSLKTLWLTLGLSLAFIGSSCSTSFSDSIAQINADTASLSGSGAWKVTKFVEDGKNETSDYSSQEFYFEDEGQFRVVGADGSTYKGTWARTTDDGLPRLVIRISGTKDLEEIDDDWVLELFNETVIELRDDNLASKEVLHFERVN